MSPSVKEDVDLPRLGRPLTESGAVCFGALGRNFRVEEVSAPSLPAETFPGLLETRSRGFWAAAPFRLTLLGESVARVLASVLFSPPLWPRLDLPSLISDSLGAGISCCRPARFWCDLRQPALALVEVRFTRISSCDFAILDLRLLRSILWALRSIRTLNMRAASTPLSAG